MIELKRVKRSMGRRNSNNNNIWKLISVGVLIGWISEYALLVIFNNADVPAWLVVASICILVLWVLKNASPEVKKEIVKSADNDPKTLREKVLHWNK